jgi:hypothetical protein
MKAVSPFSQDKAALGVIGQNGPPEGCGPGAPATSGVTGLLSVKQFQ